MADVEGLGWVWEPDSELGAGGAAALADPLGKLVHLTRLDLRGTCHGGVVCVCMPCRVQVCMGGCASVRLCG